MTNNKSKINKRLAAIPPIHAFKKVFELYLKTDKPSPYPAQSHLSLMRKYDLTLVETEVLAYILNFYPVEISEFDFLTIIDRRDEKYVTILSNLKKRGFIEENNEIDAFVPYYSITESAYDAFLHDRPNVDALFHDCYDALKSSSFMSILKESWYNKFVASFELPENKSFKEAYEKLELSSLTVYLQKVFWLAAKFFILHFTDPIEISEDNETLDRKLFFENLGLLAKAGLVIQLPCDEKNKTSEEYVLSPKAAGLLFHGRDEVLRYGELSKFAEIIKCHDIEKKDLFFSSEAQVEIDNLRTMLNPKGFVRAMGILKRKHRPLSIQSLLWGPPGTGKTETVRQLALETGRDIVKLDVAKVTAYNWGSTEKFYRSLFRAYNYIALISDNVPIFLMNEADDVLSRRLTEMKHAIDKSENTITNILLQEMEGFNGILLATTNLIDNLDPAFDRRFLFKTRLEKPDEKARVKIWKSYIPELTKEESEELAKKFEMSGAQINNVVTKRDLAELYFEGDRGLDYIIALCNKEISTEKRTNTVRPKIGF